MTTVQVRGYRPGTQTVHSHCFWKAVLNKNFQKNSVPARRDMLGFKLDPKRTGMRPFISKKTLCLFTKIKLVAPRLTTVQRMTEQPLLSTYKNETARGSFMMCSEEAA